MATMSGVSKRELSPIKESYSELNDDNQQPNTPPLKSKQKGKKIKFQKVNQVHPTEDTPEFEDHKEDPSAPLKRILKPPHGTTERLGHENPAPTENHLLRSVSTIDPPKGEDDNDSDESGTFCSFDSDSAGGSRIQMANANSTSEEPDENIKMNMDIKPDAAIPKVKENKLPTNICKVFYDSTDVVFKILFAAILFCVGLTCLIVNKGSLLLIAHQMNLEVIFSRHISSLEVWAGGDINITQTCSIPVCQQEPDGRKCAQVESVRWIWAMFTMQCLTYFAIFCRSFWKMCFKKKLWPSVPVFLWTMLSDTFSTIGTFMMLHLLLPKLDVTRGLFIISSIAFIPGFIHSFNNPLGKSTAAKVIDVIATVFQGSAFFIWIIASSIDEIKLNCFDIFQQKFDINMTFFENSSTVSPPLSEPAYTLEYVQETTLEYWCLPLALLFISQSYWHNFIDRHTEHLGKLGAFLLKLRKEHDRSATKINLILSLYNMLLTLALMALYYGVLDDSYMDVGVLFSSEPFYHTNKTCGGLDDGSFRGDWLQAVLLMVSTGIVCLCASDIAIQVKLQIPGFTVPLVIATPVTYFLFMSACSECESWDFGTAFYWNCFSGYEGYSETLTETYGYFGFLWWISLLWIARHLWKPSLERLAMLDKIFVVTFPSVVFLEQSLMLSRRRNDQEVQKPKHEQRVTEQRKKSIQGASLNASKVPTMTPEKLGTPFIYMCATMWHENQDEMITMLTSIFRMNIDQCARYAAKYTHNSDEPDYYEFEVDIYFDDAYKKNPDNPEVPIVNDFVKDFIASMDKAASVAYNVGVTLTPPTKYETPYGGRMVWKLPLTENKLILHMKDKLKIRNKKRWSQVMYMKSLLGRGIEGQKAESIVKDFVAKNTFILALDGDIDFQPEAVLHLVNLMKRDPKVAAACGRIHPTGSGPMVWYQKFEYSISHWLQKSTEHVFGSVLCSPGCFSLFRASAMLDDKIPDIYATVAKDPINFVQYDQGEDRWLCTLLIQKGHRIEYSAAADAFTNAPEEFNEFFNQRRRWITSTFANLMDIIGNGRQIAKDNESVSLIYMLYQLILFISSIVGPATIFLLICGSFELIFGMDAFWAAVVGIVPVIVFMVLCFKTKTTTQLAYASIMTVIYAVMQMFVLAGMLRVMVEEGLCGSSTIFFLFIVGVFALAALVHPFEMTNILHSFIFYLFIPSVYLLLIVYSLCNVNQISWGTREVKAPGQHQQKSKKKGANKWKSYFNIEMNNEDEDEEGGCFDGLVCCTNAHMDERLKQIEVQLIIQNEQNNSKHTKPENTVPEITNTIPTVSEAISQTHPVKYKGPWIDDIDLGTGDVGLISSEENSFWESLIKTTLPPVDPKADEQLKIKDGLDDLRNKAVFAFFIIDMLMIAFILALKLTSAYGMQNGLAISYNCTINGVNSSHSIDPIGMSFIAVFGVLMVIQVIGMLLHRVFTFLQYISTVVLCRSAKIAPQLEQENNAAQNKISYTFAKEMQRFDIETEHEDSTVDNETGSQISLKGDDAVKPSINKRRQSYTQDQLEKMNTARRTALNRLIRNLSKQASPKGQRSSKRKESIFQPVVESMRQRRSAIAATDTEVLNRNEEELINKEKQVIVKILDPSSKK